MLALSRIGRSLLALAVLVTAASATAGQTDVHPDAASVEPLAVGAHVPNPALRSIEGEQADLASVLGESGALLVFYRGGW